MTEPSTHDATGTDELLVETRGRLGVITLNRPKAINALTHAMVRDVAAQLRCWRDDDAVQAVLIRGAGERGLCAGGDIVSVHDAAKAGRFEESEAFFADEYRMNHMISQFPKPIVALQDGIVLGGGVGISGHASHRVSTERTRWGMPETGIGFVPDVGGTWLISRLPSQFGLHLGMTGSHITGADVMALGLSTHHVASSDLDALTEALETEEPDAALARFAAEPGESPLWAQRPWVDHCYAADTPAAIIARLREREEPEAQKAADRLESLSPTAISVTLAAVRRARQARSLGTVLKTEYRTTCAHVRGHDFPEGIRALLVDKDKSPHWRPATLDEVTADDVDAYFLEPASGDLEL
ncbi:enoyl-CoA hydratase/isomerase family protein [uncultured Micrococcus sp.]|uniref:enoyl-CoA hydratase/isomerase family protein n=1 Tax=uncultured Micrococcus sp. TaxID=114051 RepID=UPI00259528D2|nr:enoyl-CoA hydratase/isomerase family protein [uncultured Micrococcus sp.]